MKKIIIPILVLFFISLCFTSQAKTLQAYLNYTTFNVPEKGPFIETYLSVAGKTVIYKLNEKGLFQGSIEVTFIFRHQGEIKEFDKYQLFSPEVQDTASIAFSFIDQQRYFIPEGDYEMKL